MAENRILRSKEELAEYVGKSWRTVYRWIKEGLPVLPDGSFDLHQVDAWLLKRRGAGDQGQGGDGAGSTPPVPSDDKDFWDKESKKEQALRRQLERRKLQGELIEFRLVEDMFVSRIVEVKTLLLSFERLLPPELIRCRTDREMAEMIRKFTRRALQQFSRPLPPNMSPDNAA